MRKYFLLSAVALMAATSANATTDYAEVTAKATIEVAGTFSCPEIDWGTFVVKQGNREFWVNTYVAASGGYDQDMISHSGSEGHIECSQQFTDGNSEIHFPDVELENKNGDIIHLTHIIAGSNMIDTKIIIPQDVKAGEYTGSFTVTITKE
ncbi:MAG: hypothetical protein IJF12_04990 [Alphaproteobacteria bacterium]|nr:hypothetical protein [Alphaproteobacteria bacterium]